MQGWNWSGFFEYLTNPYLMEGAVTTLWLTGVSIAVGLVVSEGAVEKHVANIFAKLDLPVSQSDHRRVLAVLRFLDS